MKVFDFVELDDGASQRPGHLRVHYLHQVHERVHDVQRGVLQLVVAGAALEEQAPRHVVRFRHQVVPTVYLEQFFCALQNY